MTTADRCAATPGVARRVLRRGTRCGPRSANASAGERSLVRVRAWICHRGAEDILRSHPRVGSTAAYRGPPSASHHALAGRADDACALPHTLRQPRRSPVRSSARDAREFHSARQPWPRGKHSRDNCQSESSLRVRPKRGTGGSPNSVGPNLLCHLIDDKGPMRPSKRRKVCHLLDDKRIGDDAHESRGGQPAQRVEGEQARRGECDDVARRGGAVTLRGEGECGDAARRGRVR